MEGGCSGHVTTFKGGGGVHVHGSIKFVLLRVFCGGRPHPDADMHMLVIEFNIL